VSHEDDDIDWTETVDGCLYELATVGGAIVGTIIVATLLGVLVSWGMDALFGR
jgi:hypothetical protein